MNKIRASFQVVLKTDKKKNTYNKFGMLKKIISKINKLFPANKMIIATQQNSLIN